MARLSQVDLSSDKSKLDSIKPRVSISIGIQEEKKTGNNLQENCSTRKNYRRHNQDWQLQQPFYVEEPRWIDIDVDYIDSSQNMNNGDPYILTRGKKIYRIKDPEQVDKTIKDYEAIFDYPSKNRLLIKSRVRRSIKTNEGFQSNTTNKKNNQTKKRNYNNPLQDVSRDINNTANIEIENTGKSFEINKMSEEAVKTKNTSDNVSIKNSEKDDLKNVAKRSLREFKFTKKNQNFAKGIITDFVEQKQKMQREDIPNEIENGSNKIEKIDQVEKYINDKSRFVINITKRNRKTDKLLKNQELPESRKKREEIDTNFKKDVEKNETYEQMKNKAYVNKLNIIGTSNNLFMSPRDKDPFNNEIESLNKKDTERNNKSIEKAWKLHYAHHKKSSESEGEAKNKIDRSEINKDNTGITDLQLSESDSKNSEIQTRSNNREKRNVCKICKIKPQSQQDEWLKNIEKKIQESLSLERRDKQSDILEHLLEPYIISRGKKVPQDFEKDDSSSKSNSRDMDDENRAKVINLPVMESLLRMLLMEMSKCNNDNCAINANRLSDQRLSPRDRRGTLDEILAGYDPYYMARGKRMDQNQKGVSFETDAKQ